MGKGLSQTAGIQDLLAIMARLRDPEDGCPWDLEQDFTSICPYTIEEAYEVADAIHRGDRDELKDELGDLLFQVVFHARMAEEQGWFSFNNVADAVCEKMIRRHPHVFADEKITDADEQTAAWEEHKAKERADKGQDRSALAGVAAGLPPLTRARKLQARAARVGFDWPDVTGVLDKIEEEVQELREADREASPEHFAAEVGDLLFAVVNLARHRQVDPEASLLGTNLKFERRFHYIEEKLAEVGKAPADASLEEMDRLWDEAKRSGL